MTDTKTPARHVYDRTVQADIEDVWRALTDPDDDQQPYYEHAVESTWMPGEPVRWVDSGSVVIVEGTVLDVDPPHRLVHTFSFTAAASPEAAGDPPSRVTWTMEPDDDGTRVMLVHDGFDSRNATWRAVEEAWDEMLDGLVQVFDHDDDGAGD